MLIHRAFYRQLNIWGFNRLKNNGRTSDNWSHECFVRGKPELLGSIKRQALKNEDSKKTPILVNSNETLASASMADSKSCKNAILNAVDAAAPPKLDVTVSQSIPVPERSSYSRCFPRLLHFVLSVVEEEGLADIICW